MVALLANDAAAGGKIMALEDVEVVVDLRDNGSNSTTSDGESIFWTSDLTHDFVTIDSAVKA